MQLAVAGHLAPAVARVPGQVREYGLVASGTAQIDGELPGEIAILYNLLRRLWRERGLDDDAVPVGYRIYNDLRPEAAH
jgi:hypothetical protein